MKRREFLITIPSIGLYPLTSYAEAGFPSNSIKIVCPYAAGGGPDIQLRQAAPYLGEAFKQTIIVENKVGAGGVLATQYAAQSAPDGYTLMLGSNIQLIQKIIKPEISINPLADFAPISNMYSFPTVMMVAADSPYKRAEDVIAAAKANPGSMNYGSGGIGTSAHIAGATFVTLNNLKVTHIPLKGSVEIATSLIRGDTQFAFPIAGTAVPLVKGGKVRALAVTSKNRLAQLPEVPTLNEIMKNELTIQESWFGMWAPVKTPRDKIDTLFQGITKVLNIKALKNTYEDAGNLVTPSQSPQSFALYMINENKKWAEIIRLTGITAE
ncbi:tripartite tricarboxylate transporter substrate binding protein [Polynucleobacter sp. IMCC30063]|uniref:Bug family tripartite tricarboxylate transporter substrate binding protein n=1 Tax=unclassified Polynucleobacter TaxID=2640945 RepID=UPI001F2E7A54|nr:MULTISPECIES: tripartite tricarboxylate transporter substrate binding protein [unclassified Polynucleobacter]MCE7505504.1 tripartite tricarboxylate transporter substrate binding protein [Polynucleobacter sp. IMCC30063]MCE7530333.1 tripartite tricarboxylate transporter substrate binding protein [Polynucleobacter sp. IMCC 29146]